MMVKILVCGTRGKFKDYKKIVYEELEPYFEQFGNKLEIVEGCCPNSADQYAEEWALEKGVKVNHFPATSGNYLKRNIEMLEEADEVIAFWDLFSYGTAHTIANALFMNDERPPIIVRLKK
jgi:S-methylmethionine-dependent homocysteine/selenocysteine methylase